ASPSKALIMNDSSRGNEVPNKRHLGFMMVFLLSAQTGAAPISVPAFNVDAAQTSVSGLSSGAFMAVQFEVAYSSTVKGAGIVAGGPYLCAQGSQTKALGPCMAASGST